MDPAAGQRVQVERQRGDQRLAFAGAHLGDLALVQDQSADQLDIVVALADGAFGGLAHGRKGFRQELIQHSLFDLAAFLIVLDTFDFCGQALAELVRLGAQGFITEGFEFRLQRIDLFHDIGGLFDFTFIGVTPEDFDKFLEHGKYLSGGL